MKNAEYWAGRFKDLEEAEHRKGVKAVADIDQMYDRAIKDVESKIRVWYQRFADNNNITLAEAKKWLDKDALKELKWDIKEYIKYGKQNEVDQLWMKELENASAKVHISRLQALELQIRQSLEKVTADQLGETTGTMEDVYRTAYYHTAYEIDKGFGVGTDVGRIDQASIDRIINKPWAPDGKNFSDRIWENKNKLLSTIHQELTRGILTGVDPQKTIDAVAKKMNVSKHNAGRLVMTEEAYFSSLGQRDMFADLDVEKYEIVATLDSHTSEICQQMDGQVFKLSEYEAGVTAPPFHVYCRSTTAPWFDDDFGIPGERVARDEDGNREYVPADMTYKEWEKKFVNDDKSDLKTEPDDGTIKVNKQIVENQNHNWDDDTMKQIISAITDTDTGIIDFEPITILDKPRSDDEIIKEIGGGDRTSGSCASLSLAYVGQKAGLDVHDFRGGNSLEFFSTNYWLEKISQLPGVDGERFIARSDIASGKKALKAIEDGKEYILITGRHASIVRKGGGKTYQYLELQNQDSKWTDFDGNPGFTLSTRFGSNRTGVECDSYLIDVDKAKNSQELQYLLGYINTPIANQKKGVGGHAK